MEIKANYPDFMVEGSWANRSLSDLPHRFWTCFGAPFFFEQIQPDAVFYPGF
jgi:hypothetical protein